MTINHTSASNDPAVRFLTVHHLPEINKISFFGWFTKESAEANKSSAFGVWHIKPKPKTRLSRQELYNLAKPQV